MFKADRQIIMLKVDGMDYAKSGPSWIIQLKSCLICNRTGYHAEIMFKVDRQIIMLKVDGMDYVERGLDLEHHVQNKGDRLSPSCQK